MSEECIFCRIVAGEIPANRVYEDDHVLAFLDIGPVTKGHTLVIPKQHAVNIHDIDESSLEKVIVAARKVAAAQRTGLNANGINITQANGEAAGQVVPHIHFHVIPRHNDDGQPRNWKTVSYADDSEMDAFACRIREAIG